MELFNEEQAKLLIDLNLPREALCDVYYMILMDGFDNTYQYLTKVQPYATSNWRNIVLLHPRLYEYRKKILAGIAKLKEDLEPQESGITCPNCQSTNTVLYDKQVRRADEGMDTFLHCFNCNRDIVYRR
jgi:DNA-directed RNA polymerase subunit M/transcription elongation factor TFIIS